MTTSTALWVLAALADGGQGAASADVGHIDTVCKEARAAKVGVRVFAETSGAVLPKPREGEWRELGGQAELASLSTSARPPNTEAVVRASRGGTTLVSMYFQDASASWAHLVDYCYRPNGSLARVAGTYNKLSDAGAGLRRRRTTYFDADGTMITTKARLLDLDSDRPRSDEDFVDQTDPFYPALRALPFSADLMPPVSAPPGDLDPNSVVRTVRERLPAIKACYEAALRRTPRLSGKVVARWNIDGAGKVMAFTWESDQMKSPAFNTCARRVIEGWRFPPSKDGPTSVSFPFVFERSGADVLVPLARGE